MMVILATGLLSILLCAIYLRFARHWQLLDTPNERSSHTMPTPHGGGAALLMALALGLLLATWHYGPWDNGFIVLAVVALLLMGLGVIDDLLGLSVKLRLGIYGLSCLLVSVMLLQSVLVDSLLRGVVLVSFAAFAMLWFLNLYNFMDGIDGIAAIQAVFACCAAALLCMEASGDNRYALFCLLLAASHLGFLVWNWPPARLFMGDAGSVPTGFLLAALVLMGAVQGQVSPLSWLILLAPFITDATWTLLWRMGSGQAFTQPHRLHAYQRLSRHWNSHRQVDLLLLALNLFWLLPLAWIAQICPDVGFFLVILAYLPLLAGMAKVRRLT